VHRQGAFHPAVDYVGDTTVVQSMLTILRARGLRAQVVCLKPIPAAGAHRRELALAAHDAIAAALKV
jgi:1-acyl-sn-glycerol-3-phosphate acyltransferase